MNIHFIAIGGAIMHNLAICLQEMGHTITGSDDVIFDPAKSNLLKAQLLPSVNGFFAKNVHQKLDAVILGMHAKKDNVELRRAQAMGIRIYSFPEFIFEQSKNKQRVVVGGSHGKTTTTAMIMHVLRQLGRNFDYLVGSSLEGFDLSVQLSDAPLIILEGDEYLSSPIELTSKFHYYDPNIAIITGVAWDHVNVFPTWESYVKTFDDFLRNLSSSSNAILFEKDPTLKEIAKNASCKVQFYGTPNYEIIDNKTWIVSKGKRHAISIFGKHNIENMESARLACELLNISTEEFYGAIASFSGTAKRLEAIQNKQNIIAYRDFAHSPSKLKATLESVKEQYPNRKLVACMELHTFSSTDKKFLEEYKGSMDQADQAIIYMSSHAFEIKGRANISNDAIHRAFGNKDIEVSRTREDLQQFLDATFDKNKVYLFMSSGNFDGMAWEDFLEAKP